jgi:hypothetical protein
MPRVCKSVGESFGTDGKYKEQQKKYDGTQDQKALKIPFFLVMLHLKSRMESRYGGGEQA